MQPYTNPRQRPTTARHNRKNTLYLAILTLSISCVGIAFMAGRASATDTTPQAAPAPDSTPVQAPPNWTGASTTTNGVPTGYPRTPTGATNLAIAYLMMPFTQSLWDPQQFKTHYEIWAHPDYHQEIVDAGVSTQAFYSQQLLEQANNNPENAHTLLTPALYQIEHYTPNQANIRIWAVTLLAIHGSIPLQGGWQETIINLRWVNNPGIDSSAPNGDWKITGHKTVIPMVPHRIRQHLAPDQELVDFIGTEGLDLPEIIRNGQQPQYVAR